MCLIISDSTDTIRPAVKTKYINDRVFGLTQVLMETTDTNTVQAAYTYGKDLINMKRADVNSFYLYDGLGSTRQLTANNQAVVASYTYDSFGNVIASSGTVVNTYGFTGEQQFNEADNLVFLRARYYAPSIGRFISRDPIGYKAGINLYRYCKNNPITLTDPEGFAPWYGNYCGPGNNGGAPIDELDGACQEHDDCYADCGGLGGVCGVVLPSRCKRECDLNLCTNAILSRCSTLKCEIAREIIIDIFCGRGVAPW